MPEGLTDAAWIAAAVRGRREAFSELVKTHQGTVYRIALRVLRDEAEAADAAQEAFLKAFRNLHAFDQSRPFAPWLYRIARNEAIDRARRRGGSPEQLERADSPDEEELAGTPGHGAADDAPDALSRLADAERAKRVAEAVAKLDPKYREVIELFHFESLTYEEIAGTLGVPIGTVMTRIFRARGRLARLLAGEKAA